MEKSKNYLFERLINYQNVKDIKNLRFYVKFILSYFISIDLLVCIALSAIFFGYSTKYAFGIFQIIDSVIIFILSFVLFIYFYIKNIKYNIFKKNIYPILIYSWSVLTTMIVVIIGIFTTFYVDNGNGSYSIVVNGTIYFLIYFIIFIASILFEYFLFVRGFQFAVNEYKKIKNSSEIAQNNDKT